MSETGKERKDLKEPLEKMMRRDGNIIGGHEGPSYAREHKADAAGIGADMLKRAAGVGQRGKS